MALKVPLWLFATVGIVMVLTLSWYVTNSFNQSAAYEDSAYTGLYIDTTKPPTLLSSSEQKSIDLWIKKNNLNRFGDQPNTVYKEGPLKTGTGQIIYTSRFEYILAKHPDRPWKSSLDTSNQDKIAIDAWIVANGLNTFGDAADTVYAGGTPLFNEATGKTVDRYQYIITKHPTKPWNTVVPLTTP